MNNGLRLFLALVLTLISTSAFAQHRKKDFKIDLHQTKVQTSRQAEVKNQQKAVSLPDTATILAIRVDFVEDDSPYTNGNGKFDVSDSIEAEIDPVPHHKLYFEDHLESLRRYYLKASNKKFRLGYRVFPDGMEETYHLPQKMTYYNPNTTEDELDIRLGELFRDAVQQADTDEAINFSLYDYIVVFHAGVGSDFAVTADEAFNPSPQDLPSVFLNIDDLRSALGGSFEGISVDGGNVLIKEGTMLPEMESKEGVEIGLNGIFAHQFGHQLGLPSLFDTKTGRSGIGAWGLMDVGFGNVDGLVPALPCAWSRIFLGWEEPVVITDPGNYEVSLSLTNPGSEIYRVNISANEYYLIENRHTDQDWENIPFTKSERGVVLEVENYDVGIPGPGMLIWHVDEDIIRENLAANRVNSNFDLKGITLEEADAAVDIGAIHEWLIPGFGTPANGIPEDAFYSGNNNSFTPLTKPNTNANSGAKSHISITNISAAGPKMTFSYNRNYYRKGFPLVSGGDSTYTLPVEISDGTKNYIFWIDFFSGSLCAVNEEGEGLIPQRKTFKRSTLSGDSVEYELPVIYDDNSLSMICPIVFIDDNNKLICAISTNNKLILLDVNESIIQNKTVIKNIIVEETTYWRLIGGYNTLSGEVALLLSTNDDKLISISSRGQKLFTAECSGIDILETSTFTYNNEIYICASDFSNADGTSKLVLINGSGNKVWQKDIAGSYYLSPTIADLNSDGEPEIYILKPDGISVLDVSGNLSEKRYDIVKDNSTDNSFLVSSAVGDIDKDGFPELVLSNKENVFVVKHNMVTADYFPLKIQEYTDGNVSTVPTIADLNGDNVQDIVFGTDNGNIYAFSGSGEILDGFPLSCGGSPIYSINISPSADRQKMLLTAPVLFGNIYSWEINTPSGEGAIEWGTYRGNNLRTGYYNKSLQPVGRQASGLMPENLVYNYPNPTKGSSTTFRYYLSAPAEVKIKIFDLAGEKVDELAGTGYPKTDNEVVWDLTGIQSGVYMAKVEAVSAGEKKSKIVKVAVVK